MKTAGIKAKAREFQKRVAEMIAGTFGFTIEALSPLSIGKVLNNVRYVSEAEGPDLRVRLMGTSGPDVVALSDKARKAFPFQVECKIRRHLPPIFEVLARQKTNEFTKWVAQAAERARKYGPREGLPIVVFRGHSTLSWCILSIGMGDVTQYLMAGEEVPFAQGMIRGEKRRYVLMPFDALLRKIYSGEFPAGLAERPECRCGCGMLTTWVRGTGKWNVILSGHNRVHPYEKPNCARMGCSNRVHNHCDRFCSNSCKQKALYEAGLHNMQRPEVKLKQGQSLSRTIARKIANETWSGYGERGAYLSSKTGKREWYQSKLELRFFQVLDTWHEVAFWTKAHGLAIPWQMGEEAHLYIPDVYLVLLDGSEYLFEVKYSCDVEDEIVQQKAKAAMMWCQGRGIQFCFATEKNGWLRVEDDKQMSHNSAKWPPPR